MLIPLFFTQNWKSLNSQRKEKSSSTTIFIDNDFFDESKRWLQTAPEEKQHLNLDKLTKQKIARNHWRLTAEGKVVTTSDNKLIVPKRDIYNLYYVKPTQQLHIEEGTKQKDTSDNPMQESLKTSLTCLFHFVNCISNKKV